VTNAGMSRFSRVAADAKTRRREVSSITRSHCQTSAGRRATPAARGGHPLALQTCVNGLRGLPLVHEVSSVIRVEAGEP